MHICIQHICKTIYAYIVMYRTNIYILVAKCLISPCTVCFLLSSCSTFNGMYCSCYCCLVIVVIILLIVLSLFASHPGFLSIVSVRICRIISSHVSLYARVILFSSRSLRPLVSQSLFALLSGRKSPETFPDPLVLGRFTRVLLSRIVRS